MPSDSNGVYSLPSGYPAVTGETIQASQHNPPLEDLASAMTARMMRSGAAPMTGTLKIVDGSVGSPSVQFASGSSTGIYKTTNGIGFSVAGTQVAELVSGGFVKGGHFLGELIPYTGLTAPTLTVLPYGQTLSRTTYAALWAFAQTEIAAGNDFYNNGDGSTTFGVGDLRGVVLAGKDDMGGTSAGRLTEDWFGSDPTVLGTVDGSEKHTLTAAQLPANIPNSASSTSTVNITGGSVIGTTSANFQTGGGLAPAGAASLGLGVTTTTTVTINSTGGGSHPIVQPTMICNFLLFAGA